MRRRPIRLPRLARPSPSRAVLVVSFSTLGWASSCSIFPSEVMLPASGGAGASGGVAASAGGDFPTAGSSAASGGQGGTLGAGAGGTDQTLAGASAGLGGGMDSAGGEAGAPPAGGAGGSGGAGGCDRIPIERVASFTDDTWIEASKPGVTHGDEALLYVDAVAGNRALFSMTLPAAPPGAVLLSARVTLTLLENADSSRGERQLELHVLTHPVDETRTSWTNWGTGSSRRWMTPGGDFGPVIADAVLPAATSAGQLTFDVSEALSEIFFEQAVPLSLIAIEREPASPLVAPSELAFGSSEGDASGAPSLVVQYCP